AAEERRAISQSSPCVFGLVLGAGRRPALYLRIGWVLSTFGPSACGHHWQVSLGPRHRVAASLELGGAPCRAGSPPAVPQFRALASRGGPDQAIPQRQRRAGVRRGGPIC